MIDIAIIGAGPGGLTASIYGVRAGLNCVVFEKSFAGGQVVYTSEVENFPGFSKIGGTDLALNMESQAKTLGVEFKNTEIKEIKKEGDKFLLKTDKETFEAKNVVLATGASPKKLGAKGEDALRGAGVSYCATCDGSFYKGGVVAVVGGGNTAFEDAEYLSKICSKVYLIHRRNEFRADKVLQERIKSIENIELITEAVVEEIEGKFEVNSIKIKNIKTNEERSIELNGVFVAVGTKPNSEFVNGLVELDEYGYIKTNEYMKTNVDGLYAVGDIRDTKLRQIITACADGAMAVQGIISNK